MSCLHSPSPANTITACEHGSSAAYRYMRYILLGAWHITIPCWRAAACRYRICSSVCPSARQNSATALTWSRGYFTITSAAWTKQSTNHKPPSPPWRQCSAAWRRLPDIRRGGDPLNCGDSEPELSPAMCPASVRCRAIVSPFLKGHASPYNLVVLQLGILVHWSSQEFIILPTQSHI